MTASTVKIIISAEVAERKVTLGTMEVRTDGNMDESIRQGMQSAGKVLYASMLQEIDNAMQKAVPDTWENVGREARQIVTCVGTIQYKRRVYKDETGRRRKLVDEIIDLEKYHRYSSSVKQKGGYLASELPYREAADVLSWLIGDYVSHSVIGRIARQVGESIQAEEAAQREGPGEEMKPGQIAAKVLYGESDGVWISLQREEKRKAEVRVGILYTGKRTIGVGRKALENKVVVTKITKNSQEWQEILRNIAWRRYDLAKTKRLIVGGDGNAWVRQSFDLLGLPSEFVLDRYHLYREARRAFGFTSQTSAWITQICQEGMDAALPDMHMVMSKATSHAAPRMRKFIRYLVNNQDGLLDPDCRSHLESKVGNLGAIEGNVDKLVVRRLKGRGRSWRLEGAKAMLAICSHKEDLKNNAFKPFVKHMAKKKGKKRRKYDPDYGEWLHAGVPALHLCHANRPWAIWLKDKIHSMGVL